MSKKQRVAVSGLMAHGHSRLTWLLDDIEAHLVGLRGRPESRGLILDELVSFSRAFTDELHEHIEEEENEIFPAADRVAGPGESEHLEELRREHRELKGVVSSFWRRLEELCTRREETPASDESDWPLDELMTDVGRLRSQLSDHSSHERQVLGQMHTRINEVS